MPQASKQKERGRCGRGATAWCLSTQGVGGTSLLGPDGLAAGTASNLAAESLLCLVLQAHVLP